MARKVIWEQPAGAERRRVRTVNLSEELEKRIQKIMEEEGEEYVSNFIRRGITDYVKQREVDLGLQETAKESGGKKKK